MDTFAFDCEIGGNFDAKVSETVRVHFGRGFDPETKSFGKLFIAATCPCCEVYKFRPASEDDSFTLRTRGSQIIKYEPLAAINNPASRGLFERFYSRNTKSPKKACEIDDAEEIIRMLDELKSNEIVLRPKLDMERFSRGIVGAHKQPSKHGRDSNAPNGKVTVYTYLVAEIMKIERGLELG